MIRNHEFAAVNIFLRFTHPVRSLYFLGMDFIIYLINIFLFKSIYFTTIVYIFPGFVSISYNHVAFSCGKIIVALSDIIGAAVFSV